MKGRHQTDEVQVEIKLLCLPVATVVDVKLHFYECGYSPRTCRYCLHMVWQNLYT